VAAFEAARGERMTINQSAIDPIAACLGS